MSSPELYATSLIDQLSKYYKKNVDSRIKDTINKKKKKKKKKKERNKKNNAEKKKKEKEEKKKKKIIKTEKKIQKNISTYVIKIIHKVIGKQGLFMGFISTMN